MATDSCGSRRHLFDADYVCELEAGHIPPHRDGRGVSWVADGEVEQLEAFNAYANRTAVAAEDRDAAWRNWLRYIAR